MTDIVKKMCFPRLGFITLVTLALLSGSAITMDVDVKKSEQNYAEILTTTSVALGLGGIKAPALPELRFEPSLKIYRIKRKRDRLILETAPIDLTRPLYLFFRDRGIECHPGPVLDDYASDLPMGCTAGESSAVFRLFSPRASRVLLLLYDSCEGESWSEHDMVRNSDGVWEVTLPGALFGRYYAYRVDGPDSASELFDPGRPFADPYSRSVCTRNEYLHRGKTLILNDREFDWQGDEALNLKARDLIIYECHLRDMTAHPSSGVSPELAGSYPGFLQSGIRGGLEHLKRMGVNAVEFLPLHDFGNIEIPYGIPAEGVINTWNPYARNHWGYMTSYFFTPESYYASNGTLEPGEACGIDGRAIDEFKQVVKACHGAGIAVILDVVYNHVSQYDQNPFKLADKKYYFHLNPDGSFCSASGCGNDFRTERPMARRLILDSIEFWLREYHVDGFRFDLAAMIDGVTCDMILERARSINPNCIIIAEPWGGGRYDPGGFSARGWCAWNDHFRNGIKGQNPRDGLGFVFGQWWNDNDLQSIQRFIKGTLKKEGGLFREAGHAINYLESHDDHTLGDFVRIGLGLDPEAVVTNPPAHHRLTPEQLDVNRLCALLLFTSQGGIMMHAGQEWGRSQVIAPTAVPDSRVGRIDHNSYNKDNETNWLNFDHADMNNELVRYYQGLVQLRSSHPLFRHSPPSAFTFIPGSHPMALAYRIRGDVEALVLINPHARKSAIFEIPPGPWSIVVDEARAGTEVLGTIQSDRVEIKAASGMVLIK